MCSYREPTHGLWARVADEPVPFLTLLRCKPPSDGLATIHYRTWRSRFLLCAFRARGPSPPPRGSALRLQRLAACGLRGTNRDFYFAPCTPPPPSLSLPSGFDGTGGFSEDGHRSPGRQVLSRIYSSCLLCRVVCGWTEPGFGAGRSPGRRDPLSCLRSRGSPAAHEPAAAAAGGRGGGGLGWLPYWRWAIGGKPNGACAPRTKSPISASQLTTAFFASVLPYRDSSGSRVALTR
jgi:hypothetical protein